MTLENIGAAVAGAMASATTYYKRGFLLVMHVFITSFFLSYYGAHDTVKLLYAVTGFTMSSGLSHFLTAYLGATALDYAGSNIRGFFEKWKQ